jgi:hypothetical protein
MPASEWKPLTADEAIRKADEQYLHQERTAGWSAWQGDGVPPWWSAGLRWVETVITAYAECVLVTEKLRRSPKLTHPYSPKVTQAF